MQFAPSQQPSSDIAAPERPVPSKSANTLYGSDRLATVLRELDLPYITLNPGASYQGLHDSLVNYLGNHQPQMLVCPHEEHTVALAHGYAKVTGKPLAAIVHSNVGLMHASMAIFNAWCDRVPVVVLGATGPVDAAQRRPWIDWIHTARDQGAMVRQFVKWDDQPASIAAAEEALLRAALIAKTAPKGPVYVCLDATPQEAPLEPGYCPRPVARFRPAPPATPSWSTLDEASSLLSQAQNPVLLMGRVSRDPTAWQARVALAERLDALVLTDLKVGAAFPTEHRLHPVPAGYFTSAEAAAIIQKADVVVSLDWVDLAGTLREAWPNGEVAATVIQVCVDQYSHNGWSMDHQGLPPVGLHLLCEPDIAVPLLLEAIDAPNDDRPKRATATLPPTLPEAAQNGESASRVIELADLARSLRQVTAGQNSCLVRVPLGWTGELWPLRHPLDYLGYDGGGGVGSGPGMAVGGALALKGTGRLPIALLGDGDFLMGVSALWTAAHYRIPLLIVVANNQSFFNDEIHQQRIAKVRGRPVENRWIGQRLTDPELDLAGLARTQGCDGIGPVTKPEELDAALVSAVEAVRSGTCAVVDVRVAPGYNRATADALGQHSEA